MDTASNRPDTSKKLQHAVFIVDPTLGIGIVRAVIKAPVSAVMAGVGFLVFITLADFGVMVILFSMIGLGRNWARINFLVLFPLGVLQSILPLS